MSGGHNYRKLAYLLPVAVGWQLCASAVFGFGAGNYGGSGRAGERCAFSESIKHDYTAQLDYMNRLEAAKAGSDKHAQAAEAAEAQPRRSGGFLAFLTGADDAAPVQGQMDPMSRDCLSCHDGLTAQAISPPLRNDPMRRHSHFVDYSQHNMGDHPIGMDYAGYLGSPNGMQEYKPIAGRPELVLINGKVGCLTCHNPLGHEDALLSMSDYRSALCLSCHNK